AAIRANVDQLGLNDRTHVVAMDAGRFLAGQPGAGAPFDLVVADPPYDTDDDAVTGLVATLGAAPGWIGASALVSVERPVRHSVSLPPGWSTRWERTFGDTLLTFCSR